MYFFLVVNGGWSAWGSYDTCSRSCGGGTKYRQRSCNSPSPQYGGSTCPGSSSQSDSCNSNSCPSKIIRKKIRAFDIDFKV